ncbi:MAG TPA: alpha-amylase family glycosyl hydrolase, partial [Mycobacterium sp.]|nr:alpha-amylase family glycosyl hydrolase [Mycobacterium sp.]
MTSDRDDTVEHDPAEGSHVEAGVVEHPSADDFADARELPADSTWFKHAVFYEVLVRAFYDSNADGFGDLRGLTERIDYLQWLGVDCIWLPPFYDSPLRDGGYDIRDFYKVLPEFGTVDDFVELLDAAHRRGIRVIT